MNDIPRPLLRRGVKGVSVESYNKWGKTPHLLFFLLIVVMLTLGTLNAGEETLYRNGARLRAPNLRGQTDAR